MKVFVGLSGGVDSSVAAHLLVAAGHEVTGVFMRTWQPGHVPCTQSEDERAAFTAAVHLGIPFRTLDLSARYRDEVGKHFIAGYARGETPNPDVLCNREVKFGGFLQYALSCGADAVATGHYARLQTNGKEIELVRGIDAAKDQSYFLALVEPEKLSRILFPLGDYTKEQVRALARRIKLPNAARKDSQGVCFLGRVDIEEFLRPYVSLVPGAVLDQKGNVIGEHRGAALYTLGERHGFILAHNATDGATVPHYVAAIDVEKNTITVVPHEHLPSYTTLILRSAVDHGVTPGGACTVEVRYHGARHQAHVSYENGAWVVHLTAGALVAPGQTVVCYQGDRIVLAGILTAAS